MQTSNHLREILSGYALEAFATARVHRTADFIGSPDELRAMLEARGWPVYQAALDFDAAIGGLTLQGPTPLGVFAALARRSRKRVARDDDLLVFQGSTLLPAAGSDITSLWIDERGTLYNAYFADFSHDGGDCILPAYESYATLLERYALQTETWYSPELARADRRPPYRAEVSARVGAEMAAALELPLWLPATDRFAAVWRDGDRLVIEQRQGDAPWPQTRVRCASVDEMVSIWNVVAGVAAEARINWSGPRPEAPRLGDVVVRAYAFVTGGRGLQGVTVFGEPGQFRVAGW